MKTLRMLVLGILAATMVFGSAACCHRVMVSDVSNTETVQGPGGDVQQQTTRVQSERTETRGPRPAVTP
jgi:hypothetical protein